MTQAQIDGTWDARFAPVRLALQENFEERDEVGASVAVWIEGRLVVDLWGGWADAARSRPWERDTVVNAFSVGKAMVALALGLLVDRGQVDLDQPVARYWPEFAQAGKSGIAVRELAAHRAGLPAVRAELPPFAMYDWRQMTDALARETPWWPPGSGHGYHVNTYGFLIGEIVRRITGQSFGAFFREEIAGPLGASVQFGLPTERHAGVAECLLHAGPIEMPDPDPARALLLRRTYANPQGASGNGTVNTREWRAAEIPSTNVHANARGVAQVYAALVAGGRMAGVDLIRSSTLEELTREAARGLDQVLDRLTRFGLGFQLTLPERPLGPNPRTYGHFGAGGSLGFADPDAGIAFAYCMNRPGPRWKNPRTIALVDAVYASL